MRQALIKIVVGGPVDDDGSGDDFHPDFIDMLLDVKCFVAEIVRCNGYPYHRIALYNANREHQFGASARHPFV
jgi:hypothetical protein